LDLVAGLEVPDEDVLVRRAEPVNAAGALHQPDGIPRQVVADAMIRVLEIQPLRQDIRGNECSDTCVQLRPCCAEGEGSEGFENGVPARGSAGKGGTGHATAPYLLGAETRTMLRRSPCIR